MLVYRAASLADAGADRRALAQAGSHGQARRDRIGAARRRPRRPAARRPRREAGGPVARLYEDVRALRIYEGTTDVQKMLIAREVLA